MIRHPKKLIVIGDSAVYGWGDSDGGGWCERLRRHWMKLPNSPIVYSLGIRGDGLEKVAKRWHQEWQCRGELRRSVPNGLLLSIGLNDTAKIGRQDGRPQLSSEAFKFGLERLLTQIKNQTTVMMIGLTAVNERAMPFSECLWYSNEACSIYEREIEETCLQLDIPFLPIHKTMMTNPKSQQWIQADGIHLNSEGHEWLFQKIMAWPSLIKWGHLE